MKGITVEEELCRAARVRRRELEKLFKNIKVNLQHQCNVYTTMHCG